MIRAELSTMPDGRRHRCVAASHEAVAEAPVLKLCRLLVAAGVDPAEPMEVYRGGTLALRVRSVGEAAGLVMDYSAPRFRLEGSFFADRRAQD